MYAENGFGSFLMIQVGKLLSANLAVKDLFLELVEKFCF